MKGMPILVFAPVGPFTRFGESTEPSAAASDIIGMFLKEIESKEDEVRFASDVASAGGTLDMIYRATYDTPGSVGVLVAYRAAFASVSAARNAPGFCPIYCRSGDWPL